MIRIFNNEIDILLESLELKISICRGEIGKALACLPTKGGTDWDMAVDVITQLVSVHTIDNVDGAYKCLYDPGNTVVRGVDKLIQRLTLYKNGHFPGYAWVNTNELGLLISSSTTLLELRNGELFGTFRLLPYDYNEKYTYRDLQDWDLTLHQARKIISPFLHTSNNYSYTSALGQLVGRLSSTYDDNVKRPVNRTPSA